MEIFNPPLESDASTTAGPSPADEAALYEFRWDVEVNAAEAERRYGQRFMKQWKRVLQVQKMLPLVSSNVTPRHARFQLCVADGVETQKVVAREAEIAEELSHLRWDGTPEQCIAGEPAGRHPAGWQGVRVWVAFARRDVESVLGKKAKL